MRSFGRHFTSYQIDTIKNLLPAISQIALLYSLAEANSASMVEGLAHALDERMIRYTRRGVHESQQIMAASLAACENSDAVLIPLDNQLVASMPAVIKVTRSLPCLIIASNESPIHQGASIAFGVDYFKSGENAARRQIGVVNPATLDLFVNDRALKEKNVTLDDSAVPGIIHIAGDIHG